MSSPNHSPLHRSKSDGCVGLGLASSESSHFPSNFEEMSKMNVLLGNTLNLNNLETTSSRIRDGGPGLLFDQKQKQRLGDTPVIEKSASRTGFLPQHSTPAHQRFDSESLMRSMGENLLMSPVSPLLLTHSLLGESSGTQTGSTPQSNEFSALSTGSSSLSMDHLQQLMSKLMCADGSVRPPAASNESGMLAAAVEQMMFCPQLPVPLDMNTATCTWSGQLAPRRYSNATFSNKIFVGGVPWDVSEDSLLDAFSPFGPVTIEWPGRETRYTRSPLKPVPRGKVTGYVYVIFESDKSVGRLLQNCSQEFGSGGEWYFKLSAHRLRSKEIRQVQIIPWVLSDSSYVCNAVGGVDSKWRVFVGALHGMITAQTLATVINDLFGDVVCATVDTDKYKYPIGSGRVTFGSAGSYFKAIQTGFVEIKTAKFVKKVQIDPFLEDAPCSSCLNAPGPYFCRQMMCFRYFCRTCWQHCHSVDVLRYHHPLMRNGRRTPQPNEASPPNLYYNRF